MNVEENYLKPEIYRNEIATRSEIVTMNNLKSKIYPIEIVTKSETATSCGTTTFCSCGTFNNSMCNLVKPGVMYKESADMFKRYKERIWDETCWESGLAR